MRLIIQLATLLLLSVTSIKMTESCEIASNTLTSHGRAIDVTCEPGMNFSLKMEDGDELSTLEVFGNRMGEELKSFLKIERHMKSNNASLTLLGKRPDEFEKDENSPDESAALENLLENPYFTHFPAVARLIHDELQLPGWESPSVMMLYVIGKSLPVPDQHSSRNRRAVWPNISPIHQYHGSSRYKSCRSGGRKIVNDFDLYWWKNGNCYGMCGLGCSCWQFVCGDCCIHRGCALHDGYCRQSFAHPLCWHSLAMAAVVVDCRW